MNRKHALVIGGTGMLRDVSLRLVDQGFVVSVIGRSKHKHEDMRSKCPHPKLIHPLTLDYYDHAKLEEEIRNAIEEYGPISLVVSWTPSLPSLELVSMIVSEQSQQWNLYQVKGSRRYFESCTLKLPSNCMHRSIYLGFVIMDDGSRWLTNEEISNGVMTSVENDRRYSVIEKGLST